MAKAARMEQRRAGFKSRARKLMALCMGGVLLVSSGKVAAEYLREGNLQRNLQGTPVAGNQNGPEFEGQVATCTLSGGRGGGGGARNSNSATGALTLSKGNLTVTLKCSGQNNEAVPEDMRKVCSATKADQTIATCKANDTEETEAGKQITLPALLGSTSSIEWKKKTTQDQNSGEEWTLELQETDLPLVDKAFFVGCDKKTNVEHLRSDPKSDCRVDVNVKARPSSVADNNVVTCAYGKDSNPEPLNVEMTTDKNTLTIQCGSEGSLNPESYATQYCDPEGEVGSCTLKTFEDILPTFATSWWSKGADSNSATLTIPQTDFPESEQQFRVGCIPKDSSANSQDGKDSKQGAAQAAATTTSNCNVIVTVRSGSSASSSGQLVATIAGAAALTGLLVDSL
uniref:SRS domain-containing protein n=1 Tax=Neospora caninum (strain Liverpool) TaxID=572307 RepID=F0JAZ0_NEOCL|nr:SRS domain-containing protein [Neospora caninum Liverpool]CEL71256.1 TPA: SRS domain-containing protein [Neospora caninum Liverpool]